jgi:pimeloyl-ACP methyl ester carboxylesterase
MPRPQAVTIRAQCPHARIRGPLSAAAGPAVGAHSRLPGAVWEFVDVLGPLTDPAAHGGDPHDAFSVVAPSLPGYGWSGKPTGPGWGPARIADAWAELMTRLGYRHFGAQAGDWGSIVSTHLGARHAHRVVGVHLNLVPVPPPAVRTPGSEREQRGLHAAEHYRRVDSGYAAQQRTRRQTLGYGLADSPPGSAPGSWTSSGRGPTAPATPSPRWAPTASSTSSRPTGSPTPQRLRHACTGRPRVTPPPACPRYPCPPAYPCFPTSCRSPYRSGPPRNTPTSACGANTTPAVISPRWNNPTAWSPTSATSSDHSAQNSQPKGREYLSKYPQDTSPESKG